MTNDTTKSVPDERAVLIPCPFCGDPMEWRAGDYAAHTSQVDNPCPIALHGFTDRAKWNTRTPPQVKALVWESIDYGYKSDDGFWFKCRTIVGDYSLYMHRSGAFSVWNDSTDVRLKHNCQSIDAAKAAAQADYNRRILDALA